MLGRVALIGIILVAAAGGYQLPAVNSFLFSFFPAKNVSVPSGARCLIKGNISIITGERIYHVPGQKYYDNTVISPEHGERWFCTASEARAAGWRRALR